MTNISLKRIVMFIVEVLGVFKGAVNYETILNEVGVAMFILGAIALMMVILITMFPEQKEDC